MDTVIPINGSSLLLDLETRLAEKESQDSWYVLSGTTCTEFYLVTCFLWNESTLIGINSDCSDVGPHS